MASRYDMMCVGFPEYIHIGDECGELIGSDASQNGVYRFPDGFCDSYTLDRVNALRNERVESFRDGIVECLCEFCVTDTLGFIYGLYEDGYIDEYEEVLLYKMADPDDTCNSPSSYWDEWEDENPLEQILDL